MSENGELVDGTSSPPPKPKRKRSASKYVAMKQVQKEEMVDGKVQPEILQVVASGKSLKACRQKIVSDQIAGIIRYFCYRGSELASEQRTFATEPMQD